MAGHVVDQLWYFTAAAFVGVRTARMEGASRWRRERVWHFARDRRARLAAHAEIGHRVEQHARVGGAWTREELRGGRAVHDAAAIHHADAGGGPRHARP